MRFGKRLLRKPVEFISRKMSLKRCISTSYHSIKKCKRRLKQWTKLLFIKATKVICKKPSLGCKDLMRQTISQTSTWHGTSTIQFSDAFQQSKKRYSSMSFETLHQNCLVRKISKLQFLELSRAISRSSRSKNLHLYFLCLLLSSIPEKCQWQEMTDVNTSSS